MLLTFIFKLELEEEIGNSSGTDIEEEETSFIEGEDIFTLPCVQPQSSDWGALVFGDQTGANNSKNRSASTAVNRVEFYDLFSTLRKGIYLPTMDSASFNGFKTNCIKKKKKVLSLMELYNKDSITCAAHVQIYKDELHKVDKASEDFLEYVDDLLTQLELNTEAERINDISSMRREVIGAVNGHKQQILEKIQSFHGSGVDTQVINNISPPDRSDVTSAHSSLTNTI